MISILLVCDQDPENVKTSEFFEYKNINTNLSVKDRLKQHISYWQTIKSNAFILGVLANGFSIPFVTTPDSKISSNKKSALKHSYFVDKSTEELVNNECIRELNYVPSVVSPQSVSVQKSGKKRLILDLREVNKHVWKEKIKADDWRLASTYFSQDCYMTKFDLKSGYHHVDITEKCQKYLGFSWNNKYYVFTVLPFGLTSAPYIFTKCLIMRP